MSIIKAHKATEQVLAVCDDVTASNITNYDLRLQS